MRVSIIFLLIAFNLNTVKAQDSRIPILNRGGTTELLYSATLPYTYLGIKFHHGKQWGVYLHVRTSFRNNQLISPGFLYNRPENTYTEFLGSLGVSYKLTHFVKAYIGIGGASHSKWIKEPNQPTAYGWDTSSYFGGETGLLIFILDRIVLDVGFCYVFEPSVNLGVGLSF